MRRHSSLVPLWTAQSLVCVTLAGCEELRERPPDPPDRMALAQGALSDRPHAVTEDSMLLTLPLDGERVGAERPVRRAEIHVIEPLTGTTLETFEQTFGSDEVSGSVELVLPRSFDSVAVRLDVSIYDDLGGRTNTTFEVPRGFAGELARLMSTEPERTVAQPSLLDADRTTFGKEGRQ